MSLVERRPPVRRAGRARRRGHITRSSPDASSSAAVETSRAHFRCRAGHVSISHGRSSGQGGAQAPLGPTCVTSSGVLSRMSWAYLRSILSSFAASGSKNTRRVAALLAAPSVWGPCRPRVGNLDARIDVDLDRRLSRRRQASCPVARGASRVWPLARCQ